MSRFILALLFLSAAANFTLVPFHVIRWGLGGDPFWIFLALLNGLGGTAAIYYALELMRRIRNEVSEH